MIGVVSVLLLVGGGAISMGWLAYRGDDSYSKSGGNIAFGLVQVYAMGILLSTFLANILAGHRPRR